MTKTATDELATSPAHTLPSLAKTLGKPAPDLLSALLEGATEAELVALGQTISSPRLLTDDRRLYSTAYDVWTQATPEQKSHLRGFSPELLALAVHHALELEALLAEHEGRGAHAQISSATRDSSAQEAFKAGMVLRDQAAVVLRGVAGKNPALLTEIRQALGSAETSEKLAAGLSQLEQIGKRFLGHKKDTLAARARIMRLDEPYVTSLATAAAAIRSTKLEASGRASGKRATQGKLDKKDGEAFHLLKAIVDAFEKAHDIDPTIPRLVPISLRRHFGKHTRKSPASPPAGPPAAPPVA